jgi:hypothetical protein
VNRKLGLFRGTFAEVFFVIPAKAGIQIVWRWIPASAGMTSLAAGGFLLAPHPSLLTAQLALASGVWLLATALNAVIPAKAGIQDPDSPFTIHDSRPAAFHLAG